MDENTTASTGAAVPEVPPLAPGSPLFVIRYKSATTGLKMWVESIGTDPAPDDEFGRNVRGANRLKHAHKFTRELVEQMLPKVREVHFDAWIERADGSRIQPHPADTESMDE